MKTKPLLTVHLHVFHPHISGNCNTRAVCRNSLPCTVSEKHQLVPPPMYTVFNSDLYSRNSSKFKKELHSSPGREHILLPT